MSNPNSNSPSTPSPNKQQGNIGNQPNPRMQSQPQGEQRDRLDQSAISANQRPSSGQPQNSGSPLKEDVGQRGGQRSASDQNTSVNRPQTDVRDERSHPARSEREENMGQQNASTTGGKNQSQSSQPSEKQAQSEEDLAHSRPDRKNS